MGPMALAIRAGRGHACRDVHRRLAAGLVAVERRERGHRAIRPTVAKTDIGRHEQAQYPVGVESATPAKIGEDVMIAHVGDRLIVEGTHLGDRRRVGIIMGVAHSDGAPPYQVRWLDDGRTTMIFPGVEARVESSAGAAGSQ
jgi:hypothetical protein